MCKYYYKTVLGGEVKFPNYNRIGNTKTKQFNQTMKGITEIAIPPGFTEVNLTSNHLEYIILPESTVKASISSNKIKSFKCNDNLKYLVIDDNDRLGELHLNEGLELLFAPDCDLHEIKLPKSISHLTLQSNPNLKHINIEGLDQLEWLFIDLEQLENNMHLLDYEDRINIIVRNTYILPMEYEMKYRYFMDDLYSRLDNIM